MTVLPHVQHVDIRAFVSGWFRGAPFEAIRRGNVEDLVAYAFFHRDRWGVRSCARRCSLDRGVISWCSGSSCAR